MMLNYANCIYVYFYFIIFYEQLFYFYEIYLVKFGEGYEIYSKQFQSKNA